MASMTRYMILKKCLHSESKWNFDTLFTVKAQWQSPLLLVLKQCHIVATNVAPVQLCLNHTALHNCRNVVSEQLFDVDQWINQRKNTLYEMFSLTGEVRVYLKFTVRHNDTLQSATLHVPKDNCRSCQLAFSYLLRYFNDLMYCYTVLPSFTQVMKQFEQWI